MGRDSRKAVFCRPLSYLIATRVAASVLVGDVARALRLRASTSTNDLLLNCIFRGYVYHYHTWYIWCAAEMDITIDLESPEPLYAQLIAQLKSVIERGHKKPGDPLPSIRQLANDLDLNSKTVAKAYRLLERDRLIQARGVRGTFVHPQASIEDSLDIATLVLDQLTKTVSRLREMGATESEIRIGFSQVMKQPR
ncbi:MAG: GntR family transcriptional regulator [Pseudomonadota bacterium]